MEDLIRIAKACNYALDNKNDNSSYSAFDVSWIASNITGYPKDQILGAMFAAREPTLSTRLKAKQATKNGR